MDDFYTDENGNTIFKSAYYRKRGSCCKSSCLHCPYGYTLKTPGVKFEELNDSNFSQANEVYKKYFKQDDITSSLLGSAFGNQNTPKLTKENFKVLSLKGFICGLVEFKQGKYFKHYLKEEFSDQGINEAYLLSLL